MKLWLWRRHRRYPRIVGRPAPLRTMRVRPNDGQDRDYEDRITEALGVMRRAELRGEA